MTTRKHFGEFKAHTLTKHAILDAYLKAWATILLRQFEAVWFVDAFAGEGSDDVGHPGSPLIAAQIAVEINARLFPEGATKRQGMRVIAFESDPARFAVLRDVMDPFVKTPWFKGAAIVREGVLEHSLANVLKTIGDAPTLYFLDPFGIDGLSAATLPMLLAGAHNELLILFNDEGAVRLAGKVRAGSPDAGALLAGAEASVENTLFGATDTEMLRQSARSQMKRSLAGHKSNANAERIMDTAFGGAAWREIIESVSEDQRQSKFVELYDDLIEQIGGTKRLRFSVDTPDGRHKYYLIHASKDRRAYAAMKDAMNRARRKRQKATDWQSTLLEHFEGDSNIAACADEVCRHFAGRRSRWQGVAGCVKDYAVEETPLWLHECQALKAELWRRGFAGVNESGKLESPLFFTFPALQSLTP